METLCQSSGGNTSINFLSAIERRNRYAGIGAALSLLAFAFFVDPEKTAISRCLFREWTGRDCFACGLTHSLHASALLDWAAALKYHLFGPVLFWSSVVLLVYWTWELALNRKGILRIKAGVLRTGILATGIIWLGYWLMRISG